MEGYYYGYCILEQSRIRDEKYKKKSTSSSTSSLSSTGSNSEPLRGSNSKLTTVNKSKPLIPKRTKGHWFYNKMYNTFE